MTRNSWAVGGLVFFAVCLGPTRPYGEETSPMTLRDVFNHIDHASSDESAQALYEKLPSFSIETEADLIKAYSLAKRQKGSTDAEVERARQRMACAAALITESTAPHQQEWVSRLLRLEAEKLPSGHFGFWLARSDAEHRANALQFGPAIALIEAARKSRNHLALPALRAISEKGGIIGDQAKLAINEIGDPEDLERAVAHIKAKPEESLPLDGFGDLFVPRFMREIDDPTLSEDLRMEFIVRLGSGIQLGNCRPYLQLLKHSHPKVREVAAQALGSCLTGRDEALILALLDHDESDVRWQALGAIDTRVWSPKHIPLLVRLVEEDRDQRISARAALILGRRGVAEAIPALRRGVGSKSQRVSDACRQALQELGATP